MGIDFQLAPFIIAGLLVVTGYMLTRWVSNLGELKHWKAVVAIGWRHNDELSEEIAAMKAEGCRAMGALQNIFNGITAGGMPHSKLVRKIADVATDTLLLCAPCDHKALAMDNEGRIEHAIRRAFNWEQIADRLADENIAAKNAQVLAELGAKLERGRAQEAERLLGLAEDRLVVERSQGRIL